MKISQLFFVLLMLSMLPNTGESNETQLSQKNHQIEFKDNVNSSSFQALSSEENKRYADLKMGFCGIVSPNLDPISVLGIEVRNDTERRHYAELWVKQEFECTEKELKFQREVDAAGNV